MPRLDGDAALRLSHLRTRLVAGWPEVAGFAAMMAVAAFLRFHDLGSRAGWDSDQGGEMESETVAVDRT